MVMDPRAHLASVRQDAITALELMRSSDPGNAQKGSDLFRAIVQRAKAFGALKKPEAAPAAPSNQFTDTMRAAKSAHVAMKAKEAAMSPEEKQRAAAATKLRKMYPTAYGGNPEI